MCKRVKLLRIDESERDGADLDDGDRSLLPDAVSAVLCLTIVLGVEVDVMEDDGVGLSE